MNNTIGTSTLRGKTMNSDNNKNDAGQHDIDKLLDNESVVFDSDDVINLLCHCRMFTIYQPLKYFEKVIVFAIYTKNNKSYLGTLPLHFWEGYKAANKDIMEKFVELSSVETLDFHNLNDKRDGIK